MRARAAVLALVALAAACGVLRPPRAPEGHPRAAGRIREHSNLGGGPSYAIFPTQRLPLRFEHGRHLRLAGVTCERCHDNAATSAEAADRLVPSERTCSPCHAIDRRDPLRVATPAARCDACHVGFDPARPALVARVEIPPPNLRFSHRAHVALGSRCQDCHGDLRRVGLATRLDLPAMRQCFACHREGGAASAACATCHLTEPDGVLRTRFDEGWLNPPAWMTGLHHDADFWVNHRTVAAENGARCATCHRERDCIECHDGRLRDRRTHPNDYVTLHPAEARQAPDRCTGCHRAATFCEACHQRSGVALSSPAQARATGRFHPPPEQWSGSVVTARHHALEARRALGACVSCHTERDCTSCHAATGMGGAGISPHPPGWLARCGELLRASARACAQCHDDPGALALRCR
jgi:hypothetical protein